MEMTWDDVDALSCKPYDPEACLFCHGTGTAMTRSIPCGDCNGTGKRMHPPRHPLTSSYDPVEGVKIIRIVHGQGHVEVIKLER